MDFYLNFTPINSTESLKVKELSFKQLKILNKFLHNKNNNAISNCFEAILQENILDNSKNILLNNFDKFCILFLLRLASVSPEIEIKKGNFTKKTDLLPFYSAITSLKLNSPVTVDDNNLKLRLSLPKHLYFEDIFSSFSDTVDEISVSGNKSIELNTCSLKEKQNLFDKLPATAVEKIYSHKKAIESKFETVIFNIDGENDVKISPFNISLFEILKVLFFSDLKSIYDVQYLLVSKVNYNPDYIDKNTLLENIMLINSYSDEMAKTSEETKKALDVNKPSNK